jgi:transcriptional regulator GlxA family with amidase domain
MRKKRNIGILIFEDAEVLDFAGPFEVFSVASELNNFELFNVFTLSERSEPVSAMNGLSVNPKYNFQNCPAIDILIIAGGFGVRKLIKNKAVLDWLSKVHQKTELTLSICSSTLLLGALGLLKQQPYCTHHQVYEDMKSLVPTGIPQHKKRFVKAGRIYTSAGISAGIDLSFHVLEELLGAEIAKQTARYMEYRRQT